jgi:hypothetical protein
MINKVVAVACCVVAILSDVSRAEHSVTTKIEERAPSAEGKLHAVKSRGAVSPGDLSKHAVAQLGDAVEVSGAVSVDFAPKSAFDPDDCSIFGIPIVDGHASDVAAVDLVKVVNLVVNGVEIDRNKEGNDADEEKSGPSKNAQLTEFEKMCKEHMRRLAQIGSLMRAASKGDAGESLQTTTFKVVRLPRLECKKYSQREPHAYQRFMQIGEFRHFFGDLAGGPRSAGELAVDRLCGIISAFKLMHCARQDDIQELVRIAQEIGELNKKYVQPTGGALERVGCWIKNFLTTSKMIRAANDADILISALACETLRYDARDCESVIAPPLW